MKNLNYPEFENISEISVNVFPWVSGIMNTAKMQANIAIPLCIQKRQ